MLDHVIRGATVVDGTGAPAYTADVGIRDGRVAVTGTVTEPSRTSEDAHGLVLAPGFGVQYLVVLVPLLYAVNPRFANLYGAMAGLFLVAAYNHYWDRTFPVSSLFDSMFPVYVGIIGLLPWVLLVGFIVVMLFVGGRAARVEQAGG